MALSDTVLLMQTPRADSGISLYAYIFQSGRLLELSTDAPEMSWPDIQGTTAVWREGTCDEVSGSWSEQHIYSCDLVTGEKREVLTAEDSTGAGGLGNPQVSEDWFTWTQGKPYDGNPEEYRLMPIHGLLRSADGSTDDAVVLAASPVAAVLGDSDWTYSLSRDSLAWEQNAPEGGLDRGIYVLDLTNVSGEPRQVATEGWRPSLWGDYLIYSQDGVRFVDLRSGDTRLIDSEGDYPTAPPTYAVYFRSQGSNGGGYDVVARGLSGGHEQVLSTEVGPPWLSTPLAAAQGRVAFVTGSTLHVYKWEGASEMRQDRQIVPSRSALSLRTSARFCRRAIVPKIGPNSRNEPAGLTCASRVNCVPSPDCSQM